MPGVHNRVETIPVRPRTVSLERLTHDAKCRNEITEMGSLFEGIPSELPEELFDTISSTDDVNIERIVSRGHASPEGFWYDQENNEFVLVVKGSAGLKLENEDDIVVLKAGDYFNIEAHVKHRVEWTDSTCETIWLAVHY